MGTYTITLIIFGTIFSITYIKYSNTFGKIITGAFLLVYTLILLQDLDISIPIPVFFIHVTALLLCFTYSLVNKSLPILQKTSILAFCSTVLTYNSVAFIGEDPTPFKPLLFISIAIFGYIYYEKQKFIKELSFLNLIFVECIMSLSILLNS